MIRKSTLILLLFVSGCGGSGASASRPTTWNTSTDELFDSAGESPIRLEPVESLIAEEGFRGAFVLRLEEDDGPQLLVANQDLADELHTPCSTFKIPNTLIGLETGTISGVDFTLSYDNRQYAIEAWNQDQTLSSAMNHSVVWYFQEIARRIGHERMSQWVETFDYGNREIGDLSSLDRFWLEGPIAISPLQQVRFLYQLTSGELPITQRSYEVLHEVMPYRDRAGARIFAKTGTCIRQTENHAWLVGWVESNSSEGLEHCVVAHFALLMLGEGRDIAELTALRWEFALQALELADVF